MRTQVIVSHVKGLVFCSTVLQDWYVTNLTMNTLACLFTRTSTSPGSSQPSAGLPGTTDSTISMPLDVVSALTAGSQAVKGPMFWFQAAGIMSRAS